MTIPAAVPVKEPEVDPVKLPAAPPVKVMGFMYVPVVRAPPPLTLAPHLSPPQLFIPKVAFRPPPESVTRSPRVLDVTTWGVEL